MEKIKKIRENLNNIDFFLFGYDKYLIDLTNSGWREFFCIV